jgi:hypothetical protein
VSQGYPNFYALRKVYVPGFFTPPVTNCISDEFSMPGQGFRMKGTTGGLSYTSITTPTTTAQAEGSLLQSKFFTTFVPTQTIRVLVADDFGSPTQPTFALPDAVFAPSSTNTTLETLQRTGQLTHGPLVLEHLSNVVAGTGLYPSSTANSGMRTFLRVVSTNPLQIRSLQVEGVNIRNSSNPLYPFLNGRVKPRITTQDVVTALLTKLTATTTPVVVNMSFVFVPCQLEEDFLSWEASLPGTQTFDQYIETLATRNSPRYWTDNNSFIDTEDRTVSGQLQKGERTLIREIIEATDGTNGTTANLTDDDPLLRLIRDNLAEGRSQNIYVASSGNYGLDLSMFPAAWAGVINVTGSAVNKVPTGLIVDFVNERAFRATARVDSNGDGTLDKTIKLFNQGEVMPVGATFSLTRNNRTINYLGTSYSAPIASAYSALDATGVFRCAETNTPVKSELAADTVTLVDRALETLTGILNAAPTTGAVQARCGAN